MSETFWCTQCETNREAAEFMAGKRVVLRTCGHVMQRNVDKADFEIIDGELEGWDIMLKVVTNGCGRSAILLQSNVVYEGPTEDMHLLVARFAEFMLEE